ncbi:MAG: 6-phosphogluconolactonase [Candidatus Kariarchaeaceae archaeon]|jgi:6-phosphogluconolactonase
MFTIYKFDNIDKLSNGIADHVSRLIEQYLDQEKSCSIALSGGNTPRKMYEIMGSILAGKNPDITTSKLIFTQVDERWVEYTHDRSNQKMISNAFADVSWFRKCFLTMPSQSEFNNIQKAVSSFTDQLQGILSDKKMDTLEIAILGMGSDGHTASLFPYNKEYRQSLEGKQLVLHTYIEEQQESRISLSPYSLRSITHCYLLITGREKGRVLKQALLSDDFMKYPIKTVLTKDLLVFMDKACRSGFDENSSMANEN